MLTESEAGMKGDGQDEDEYFSSYFDLEARTERDSILCTAICSTPAAPDYPKIKNPTGSQADASGRPEDQRLP